MTSLTGKPWYDYIEHDLIELLDQSFLVLEEAKKWKHEFHDYSFVVFSAAKAYEGFLKKLFLDLGFITQKEYQYKYFRIGKALNPEITKRRQRELGIYEKLVSYCRGEDLAKDLWETWSECRNLLFHWFPQEKNVINLKEAEVRINRIIASIDKAFEGCKIKPNAQ